MIERQVASTVELSNIIQEGQYRLVIFDFDGTLVNTIDDVIICFNKALSYYGLPECPEEKIKRLIGGDLETIVSNILPPRQRTREMVDKVKQRYREIYIAYDKPNSRPFCGVRELLYQLQEANIIIAINSNKGQVLLDAMVEECFGEGVFASAIGYDEMLRPKPDPYGVMQICDKCHCMLKEVLYVGDGNSDRMTAQNAGVDFVMVSWGEEERKKK